jgi:HPt (histidine-containing phosphotransfer) domain-containing protein
VTIGSESLDKTLHLDEEMLGSMHSLDDHKGVFLNELIDIYKSMTPDVLKILIAAIEAKNYPEASRLAHKLKGMCGNVGIKRLIALLEKIEIAHTDISPEEWQKLPETLSRDHAISIVLLQEHWYTKIKAV